MDKEKFKLLSSLFYLNIFGGGILEHFCRITEIVFSLYAVTCSISSPDCCFVAVTTSNTKKPTDLA